MEKILNPLFPIYAPTQNYFSVTVKRMHAHTSKFSFCSQHDNAFMISFSEKVSSTTSVGLSSKEGGVDDVRQ